MNSVRLGIIGMGHIGQRHAQYLLAGQAPRAELVAVCNPSAGKLEQYKDKGLRLFTRAEDLLGSGAVDAVVVATPHYQHLPLGVAALAQGLHLMVEKPIAAHKADAERLIAAHSGNPKLVFGAMFQLRVEPRYRKIKELLQSGALGQVVRVSWMATDWFRTAAYYASSGWRATWRGEGGGVLINQCLHNLDCLQWLLGMPARVRGFCQLGRFHEIEVEDNVSAYLEFPNGATGTFVSSTGEAPGTNRLEIAGTLGKLVLEQDKLLLTRNAADMIQFSKTAKPGFGKPEAVTEEVSFENAANSHAAVMTNFVNAILDGAPLVAPGAEGLQSIELANAILYSSLLDATIHLPLDGAAYEAKLMQLAAESKVKKKAGSEPLAAEDF